MRSDIKFHEIMTNIQNELHSDLLLIIYGFTWYNLYIFLLQ